MRIIHIDSFVSSAAEIKRGERSIEKLIDKLKENPRISYWDFLENRWLRMLVKKALKAGLIEEVYDVYPWFRYKITNLNMSK